MSDKALYCDNLEVVPAGTADGILKRTAANTGWEFRTAAQLGLAPTLIQTTFVEQVADKSTGSAAFVTLLTQAITIQAGSKLIVLTTMSASDTAGGGEQVDFQITIDGVAARGAGIHTRQANHAQGAAITIEKLGLAAGAHTVLLRWRTTGPTANIRPTSTLVEHASLVLQEVTV